MGEPCSGTEEDGSCMGEGLGDLLRGRDTDGDSCGEETEREPRGSLEDVGGKERVEEEEWLPMACEFGG